MINLKHKALRFTAIFLSFAMAQLYLQVGFANTAFPPGAITVDPPRQVVGTLVTRGNQPILVNGNNAATGTSILTGATIETPNEVGASINLGPLGTVDLAPNASAKVAYSDGTISVTLAKGCGVLKTKKNVAGSIDTGSGTPILTDKNSGGAVNACFPGSGESSLINQGGTGTTGGGASASSDGFSPWWLLLGIGPLVPVLLRDGSNPSPFRG